MNILNTGWYNPVTDIFALIIIIFLTLIIEIACLQIYSYWRKISVSDNLALVFVIMIGNLISGVIGFLLQWVI